MCIEREVYIYLDSAKKEKRSRGCERARNNETHTHTHTEVKGEEKLCGCKVRERIRERSFCSRAAGEGRGGGREQKVRAKNARGGGVEILACIYNAVRDPAIRGPPTAQRLRGIRQKRKNERGIKPSR